MSKFKYERFDLLARLVDVIILMVMPLLTALFLMFKTLETAPAMVIPIYAATIAYYAVVVIKTRNGTILSPKKDAMLLGWLVSKVAKKEMEEFGKLPISPAFFENIRNS